MASSDATDPNAPTVAPDPSVDVTISADAAGDTLLPPSTGGDYGGLTPVAAEHYTRGREIARGGMGRIIAAHDRRLGRPVALKELLRGGPDAKRRFEREARITARLQHPAIVSLHEAGTWPSGEPFYAMKLVEGESLDAAIARTRSLADRLALLPHAIAVVDALAYAHSRRVIHRDLKPHNVLVGAYGETVVVDWGLAKDLGDTAAEPASEDDGAMHRHVADATVAGAVLGTPAYMAPEQARGEALDERADVYALGAMLYHLLAGSPPVSGASGAEIMAQVAAGEIAPLQSRQAGIAPDLLAIVDKATAHDAKDRYRDAGELAADLKKFQTGQLVGAHRYSTRQLIARWVRRHRGAVAVAAVLLTVLAVVSVVAAQRVIRERDAARRAEQVAESRRGASEELIDFMLTSLLERLEATGQLAALAEVADAVVAYLDRVVDDQGRRGRSADELVQRSGALAVLASVQSRRGDEEEALRRYKKARDFAGRALMHENRDEIRSLLARRYFQVGDSLDTLGRREEARASFDTGIELAREVLARLPADREATRVLASIEQRLCYDDVAGGELARGEAHCDEAIRLRDEQLARAPGDHAVERELASGLRRRAWVLHLRGDHDAEERDVTRAVALAEGLVDADPGHAGWRWELAMAHLQRGRNHAGRGHYKEAREAYLRAEDSLLAATQLDPTNRSWAGDLAEADLALTEAATELGDLHEALIRAGSARARAAELRDVKSVRFVYMYLWATNELGKVDLARGEHRDAARVFGEGVAAGEANLAAKRDPIVMRYLTWMRQGAGTAWLALDDRAAATRELEAGLALGRELIALPDPQPIDTATFCETARLLGRADPACSVKAP